VIVFGTTDDALVTSISLLQILAVFVLTVILSCVFSLLMHLFIENPFINMSRARLKGRS
jgi:peptidoglycan/LPS O-acetylase OafA/YrhL